MDHNQSFGKNGRTHPKAFPHSVDVDELESTADAWPNPPPFRSVDHRCYSRKATAHVLVNSGGDFEVPLHYKKIDYSRDSRKTGHVLVKIGDAAVGLSR